MASERELNLLIKARDEASKVIRGNERAFRDMERSIHDVERVSKKSFEAIPEHLKPISDELHKTSREFRELGRTSGTVDELADSLRKTRVAAEGLTKISESGKDGIRVMQELAEKTKEAEMAALGLSRNGDIRLTTEQAQAALERYQEEIKDTQQELEQLKAAGNFGAFNAGMLQLEQSTKRVRYAMAAANQGGMAYYNTLRRMGIYSSNTADFMAANMEMYRDRFIMSIDMMQSRATQGEKIQESFERLNRPLIRTTRFLNGISAGLEKTAKLGMPAAVALQELGPNASMKSLLDMVRFINQGIARFTMLSIAAGVAFLAFTAVLAIMAHGPNVKENLEQQQEALQEYTDALKDRTQEIYDTWGLFEKAQINATKPETLIKNLQGQVKVMQDWSNNLKSLVAKGVDEGLIQELQKMGPAAAGEIAALNQMSGPELDKYVELWRQKHNLARTAAMTELEGLKAETMAKIKELQESLRPLGIAFEKFKSTWWEALQPLVTVFGIIAAKVLDFFTAIGSLIVKLNEINPAISAAAGMFMYLFTALLLILAPLAIGISRTGSMAVAFRTLYMMIAPLVAGFMAVAAYAAVIAAALVALGYVMTRLWQNSEDLRNSITYSWERIKNAVMRALEPLGPAFEELKNSFMVMLSLFTGGGGTMQSVWQSIGDKIAVVINIIVSNLLPLFIAGIRNAVQIIMAVVQGLIFVFDSISAWWLDNSDTIGGALEVVKGYFMTVFGAVSGFIKSIMPEISNTISMAVELIKTVFSVAMPIISGVVKVAFGIIKEVMTILWPIVVAIIQGAWENIKAVISSGIAIIQNVIQLFTNILKGNWSEAWENVKNILYNAVIFLWNLVQLWFLGRMIASIGAFIGSARTLITTFWSGIQTAFSTALTAIRTGLQASWTGMVNTIRSSITAMGNTVKAGWSGIVNAVEAALVALRTGIQTVLTAIHTGAKAALTAYKNLWLTIFRTVKDTVVSIVKSMWNGIKSVFETIKNAITTLKDDIIKVFKGIDLYDIGKNIIQGLINGISGMAGKVWDKITDIGKGIKDKISGILDINSPSVVMFEIGKWVSMGLASGIEKFAGKAIEVAGRMAEGVINPVEGVATPPNLAGYGNTGGGNKTVYVTFEEGAFNFPNVTNGEEVKQAMTGVSLKAAFQAL